jgi:hypothetical protein
MSFLLYYDLMLYSFCPALFAEEVDTPVKLMFDQPLTDWGNEIPAPFSSDNPPSEVQCCLLSVKTLLDDDYLCLLTIGAFPEVITDVVLSNDNDDAESTCLPG